MAMAPVMLVAGRLSRQGISPPSKRIRLERDSAQDLQQLGDLLTLLLGVATGDRMLHAMLDMVLQALRLDLLQRGLYRLHLGHDIDAVALVLAQPGDTAALPLHATRSEDRPAGQDLCR